MVTITPRKSEKCGASGLFTSTGYACANPAKHQEDGKWWCGVHLPSKVKAKREARYAEYDRKWAADNAENQKRLAAQKLLARKAAAYDQIAATWNDGHQTEADSVHRTFAIIKQIEES